MTLGQWERSEHPDRGLGQMKGAAPGRGAPVLANEVSERNWNNVVSAILELQAAYTTGAGTLAWRRNSGADVGARPRANLIEGSGITIGMVDDPTDSEIDITLTWSGLTVRKNSGADVGTRRRVNLLEGTAVALTVVDDGAGGEIDVTIATTAASVGSTPAGAILIGDTAAAGSSAESSRIDHRHSLAAPGTPAQLGAGASSSGSGTAPAREDHAHRPRVTIGGVHVFDVDADGQITLVGGTGAAGQPGEPVSITGGAGGTGNTAGADVVVDGGAKSGSGADGRVFVGAAVARQVVVGGPQTDLVQLQGDALSLIPPGGTEGTRDVATVLSVAPASAVAGWSLLVVEGDPNGQVATGPKGSLASDVTNNRLYQKDADSPSTAWTRIDVGAATLQTAYNAGEVIALSDARGSVEINTNALTSASDAVSPLSIGAQSLATATAPAVTATAAGTARGTVYNAVPAMTDPAQGGNYGIGYRIAPASLVSGHVDLLICDGDPNGIAGPPAGSLAQDRGGGAAGKLWLKDADSPSTAWSQLATGGGGTLDDAYNAASADNDISITSAKGALILRNSADATNLLELRRTFAGAGRALLVDMGASTTAEGLLVSQAGSGAAARLTHTGSGSALHVHGTTGATYTGYLAHIQADIGGASHTALRVESSSGNCAICQDIQVGSNAIGLRIDSSGAGDLLLVRPGGTAALTVAATRDITLLGGAVAATAGAGATATIGKTFSVVAGAGGAASAGAPGGAGGPINITGAAGGAASSAQVAGDGSAISLTSGPGGAGDAGNNRAGGWGGALNLTAGTGAAAAGTAAGRNGGTVLSRAGTGGAAGASAVGGAGGIHQTQGGTGGSSSTSQTAGEGGQWIGAGGTGGTNSSTGHGGAGGVAGINGGAGGAASGAGNGGAGAIAHLISGSGGNGTVGGRPGEIQIITGTPGTGGSVDAADITMYSSAPTGTGRNGHLLMGGVVGRPFGVAWPMTNKSGATRAIGDVVVIDTATDHAVTTTTTTGLYLDGVVVIGGAADATIWVAFAGIVKVRVNAASVNIARGDLLAASAAAGRAEQSVGYGSMQALQAASADNVLISALITSKG